MIDLFHELSPKIFGTLPDCGFTGEAGAVLAPFDREFGHPVEQGFPVFGRRQFILRQREFYDLPGMGDLRCRRQYREEDKMSLGKLHANLRCCCDAV